MATKDTGISNLTEEQLEELKQIFENERNKNTAWENAKEKIKGLNGSMTKVKPELIKLGLITEIESLGFTSVSQYKVFVREQESLPTEDQDKQLSTLKHCPTPTEGLYVDVWHFNEKARTDRQNLLQKANAAARESKRSYLPYIYIHGIGMSFDELKTLMNANGFVLESKMESYCDKNGDLKTKKVEFFVDTIPQGEMIPEGVSEAKGEAEEYNLDRRGNSWKCYKLSVTKKTADAMDKLLMSIKEGVPINKPRKSALYELVFSCGIANVQERFDRGELDFGYENKQVSYEKRTFSKRKTQ